MQVLQYIKFIMSSCWDFFMINVPGFRFNFGEFFVALTLARISLNYLQTMLGVTTSGPSDRDVQYVSGSIAQRNRRPIGFGR